MKPKILFFVLLAFLVSMPLHSTMSDNQENNIPVPTSLEVKQTRGSYIPPVRKGGYIVIKQIPQRVYRYRLRVVADNGVRYDQVQQVLVNNTTYVELGSNPFRVKVYLEDAWGANSVPGAMRVTQVNYTSADIKGNGTPSVELELFGISHGDPYIYVDILE